MSSSYPFQYATTSSTSPPATNLRAPSPYDFYAPDPTFPFYSSALHPPASDYTLSPSPSPVPSASSAASSAARPLSKGQQRQLRRERLQQERQAIREQERQERHREREQQTATQDVSHSYTNLLITERQPSPNRARGLHPAPHFAPRHLETKNFENHTRSISSSSRSLTSRNTIFSTTIATSASRNDYSPIPSPSPSPSPTPWSRSQSRSRSRRLFDDAASAHSAISNNSTCTSTTTTDYTTRTTASESTLQRNSPVNPFSNEYAIASPQPASQSPKRPHVRPLPPHPSKDSVISTTAHTHLFLPERGQSPYFDQQSLFSHRSISPYYDAPSDDARSYSSVMSNPHLAAVAAAHSDSSCNSHVSDHSAPSSGYVSNPSPNDYSYPTASPPSPVHGPNVPLHHDFDMALPPRINGSVTGSLTRSPSRSASSLRDPFQDDHYSNYASSRSLDPHLGEVNPDLIADDGDDGLTYHKSGRSSMINLNKKRDSIPPSIKAATAMGGAVILNSLPGGSGTNSERSTAYGAFSGTTGHTGAAAAAGFKKSAFAEKNPALSKNQGRKNWKWCIILVFGILIVGAIVGGTLGGYMANHGKKSSSKHSSTTTLEGQSAGDDARQHGVLTKDSNEIKKLLNNANLHKVFPGMDYTPINTQYPDCLKNPPSQNNVTRDVAVLSQLTNTIRVYGTDCNQTEMIIEAFKNLDIRDTMKIWLGVWQDGNSTTNDRQLTQMWHILDTYGESPFKGLIIANEILYRKEMTETELGTLMASVRTNLTSKGLSLPVGTSDLGDKWTSSLAAKSDVIMSNIHPFFGGVPYAEAANWTYSFFEDNNEPFFKSEKENNIISEIGWPTSGGTNCATGVTSCDNTGSVASIDGLNVLLDDWVCEALTNGTNYFWFSAFDEPWKARFNTASQAWEDQWGLMDVNRNLKAGVKIPNCGGKTISQ